MAASPSVVFASRTRVLEGLVGVNEVNVARANSSLLAAFKAVGPNQMSIRLLDLVLTCVMADAQDRVSECARIPESKPKRAKKREHTMGDKSPKNTSKAKKRKDKKKRR